MKKPRLLQDFLTYLTVVQGKSKRTRKEYEYDLCLFLRFIKCIREDIDIENIEAIEIGDIDVSFIADISLEDLYYYLEYCQEARGNSSNTKARKVASLKAFFKYLTKKKKVISVNPADELETPKKGKRNPIYLTVNEVEQLFLKIRKTHYYRDLCILTLFLNCGMRISELCNINLNSITEDRLSIIGKGNKEREVYLNEACLEAIENYITKERSSITNIKEPEALFISQKGGRMTPRTIQLLVKKLSEEAELNKTNITPHKFRHTMATISYQNGTDLLILQQILGHSSVSTTQVYTQTNQKLLRTAMKNNPFNIVRGGNNQHHGE